MPETLRAMDCRELMRTEGYPLRSSRRSRWRRIAPRVGRFGAALVPIAMCACHTCGCPKEILDARQQRLSEASAAEPVAIAEPLKSFDQVLDGTAHTFRMIAIDAGETEDGAVIKSFWIGEKELLWDLYDVWVYRLDEPGADDADPEDHDRSNPDAVTRPTKPYISMDRGFGHNGYAALSMSFHSATEFCKWLSEKTGRTYRLPTEAEWKLVCSRSGVEASNIDDHAWHLQNTDWATHEAGTKKKDALGLYDLCGNAGEWCVGANGKPLLIGGSYRDSGKNLGCGFTLEPTPDWNASDPQIPQSIWWLADAGFVGMRLVCVPDSTDNQTGGTERTEGKDNDS